MTSCHSHNEAAANMASDQLSNVADEAINVPASAEITTSTATDVPTQPASSKNPPRLFLELFAGVQSPLSNAVLELGLDCFGPFDFALHETHDILDDRVFQVMLRLAYSGFIGIAWGAPPCKEFSRLKLKRPGPKALRTPEFMDGVPGLSTAEQARVDANTAIHSRFRAILRGVVSTAGQAGMEQPPSAMSWLQGDNIDMLREWAAHCSYVAACSHGMNYYKSWALCASFESIAQLASVCTHPAGSHSTIAGARHGDKYVSELTAEYPPSLAHGMAKLFAPCATNQGWQNASSSTASFLRN